MSNAKLLYLSIPPLVVFTYYIIGTKTQNSDEWPCEYPVQNFNLAIPISQIIGIFVYIIYELTRKCRENYRNKYSNCCQ